MSRLKVMNRHLVRKAQYRPLGTKLSGCSKISLPHGQEGAAPRTDKPSLKAISQVFHPHNRWKNNHTMCRLVPSTHNPNLHFLYTPLSFLATENHPHLVDQQMAGLVDQQTAGLALNVPVQSWQGYRRLSYYSYSVSTLRDKQFFGTEDS